MAQRRNSTTHHPPFESTIVRKRLFETRHEQGLCNKIEQATQAIARSPVASEQNCMIQDLERNTGVSIGPSEDQEPQGHRTIER